MKKEGQVRVGLVLKAKAIDSTRGGGGVAGVGTSVCICVCAEVGVLLMNKPRAEV